MEKYTHLRTIQPSIPVNEAFSELHGQELTNLAFDMVQFRRKLVKELRNTRSLESTRLLLESKVAKYMKNEYDNKYGRLERLKFSEDTGDLSSEFEGILKADLYDLTTGKRKLLVMAGVG
jgi:hypothetical protein